MSRKYRNEKSGSSGGSVTRDTVSTTAIRGAVAGHPPGDHELSVVGIGNVNRRFDLDEPTNGPSLVFRGCVPCSGITHGWSSFDDTSGSSQDWDAATNVALDPDEPLYPITVMAAAMAEDVWPVIATIFASGTGSRYKPTLPAFVRYQSMVCEAYSELLLPITINHLTYHMDWSDIFPFTGQVPTWLYDYATSLEATDVGLAQYWLPLMKRLDTKVVFPRLVEEIKRALRPRKSVDLNGRIAVTLPGTLTVQDGFRQVYDRIDAKIQYLDAKLADAGSVFTTFLPFPISVSQPWALDLNPSIDVLMETAAFNSGCTNIRVFGDTNDPTFSKDFMLKAVASTGLPLETRVTTEPGIFYSRTPQPTWAEIRLSTLFELTTRLTDDTYRTHTLHSWTQSFIVDDAKDLCVWEGAANGTSHIGYRYLDYANSRFAYSDVEYGTMKAGLTGCEIILSPVMRLARLDTSHMYHLQTLKAIHTQLTGASLRELRTTFSGFVQNDMSMGR